MALLWLAWRWCWGGQPAGDGEPGGLDGPGVGNHMTPAKTNRGREGAEGQSGSHYNCKWIHHSPTWKIIGNKITLSYRVANKVVPPNRKPFSRKCNSKCVLAQNKSKEDMMCSVVQALNVLSKKESLQSYRNITNFQCYSNLQYKWASLHYQYHQWSGQAAINTFLISSFT
jgi:hypothetical protein